MYSIISSLAMPLIVINATRNYFAWANYQPDTSDSNAEIEMWRRQVNWNLGISASIFFTGTAAVCVHAMKFQKPTPLIMSAMAYRIIAIFLISFATGYSGAAVNRWCYDQKR